MPKAILPEDFFSSIELLAITDGQWKRLVAHIPATLSPEADAWLQSAILASCSWFLTQQARLREGQATATAMRQPSKGLAPVERWAKAMRAAVEAARGRGQFHDDRRSDLQQQDEQLEALAKEAERRLAGLRVHGKARTYETPWREFVRKVAQDVRRVGLNPTVTGEVYEDRSPTWFQEFMAVLQEEILGLSGKPIARPDDREWQLLLNRNGVRASTRAAFAAEIAKAISYRKPGKSRK
jgi:hypothetical protein